MRPLLCLLLCLPFHVLSVAAEKNVPEKSHAVAKYGRGTPLPKWALPVPELRVPETAAPVSTVLSDTQFFLGKETEVLITQAIQVNEGEMLGAIGQFAFSFYPEYQKAAVHKIVILRSGRQLDQTQAANIRVLNREEGLDRGVYGGAVTVQALLSDVRVGDTLAVTFSIRGTNPVFDGRWFHSVEWDATIPAAHRRLVVTHPVQRQIRWKQQSDLITEAIPFRSETIGNEKRLIFEQRNLEAFEYEEAAPREFLQGRLLQFSEYRDWAEVAAWADGMFPAANSGNPEFQDLVRRFSKEPTADQRVSAALKWVQEEIRYFSVSIGENSHRPQLPEVVLKRRYGDCKDKTYLLVSLLRAMGVDAAPILVLASAPKYPSNALPSPGMFDHVVVQLMLDGKQYTVDPTLTGQREGLADLPAVLPEASGLAVNRATASLSSLPPDTVKRVTVISEEDIDIPSLEADATLHAQRFFNGDAAARARRHFSTLTAARLKKVALELYEMRYPGISLDGVPVLREQAGSFVLDMRFKIPKPLTLKNGRYELPVESRLFHGALGIPAKVVRRSPFAPAVGKQAIRHIITVHWPKEARLNEDVEAKTIENDYFSYRRELSFRGSTLHYQADFKVLAERVPAADMSKLAADANALSEMQTRSLSVAAASLVKQQSMALPYRDLAVASAISLLPAQVQALKGNGADKPVDLWCQHSINRIFASYVAAASQKSQLGRIMPEFDRQADRPGARRCLAYTAFMLGDSAAVLRYHSGDTAWEAGAPLIPRLAWSRYFAGDAQGAVSDMARYVDARTASGVVNTLDLIRFAALLKRTGQVIPERIAGQLATDENRSWPHPLARFLAGRLDAHELLAHASAEPEDAREMALTEAWYYIGSERVVAGDIAGGKNAFRYVSANGVRSLMENDLAVHELKQFRSKDPGYVSGIEAAAIKDYRSAHKHLQLAVEHGDADAQYELGQLHYSGSGTPRDFGKAFQLVRDAANRDVAGAKSMLGYMYDKAEGHPQDVAESRRWFEGAAADYDPDGLFNLGLRRMEKWLGVAPDKELAIRLLAQSAHLGNVGAQANLAHLLRGKEPRRALFWAGLAATNGNTYAYVQLAEQQMYGQGTEKDVKAGLAIHNLGDMYENGIGVPQDYAKAIEWYHRAAAQEEGMGFLSLAALYERGMGAKPDLNLSCVYYVLAGRYLQLKDEGKKVTEQLDAESLVRCREVAAKWQVGLPLPGI